MVESFENEQVHFFVPTTYILDHFREKKLANRTFSGLSGMPIGYFGPFRLKLVNATKKTENVRLDVVKMARAFSNLSDEFRRFTGDHGKPESVRFGLIV